MLHTGNVQQVVKHSMAYGFLLSQPFSFYVDAYPVLQNEILTESQNLKYGQHNESVLVLQYKLSQLNYFKQPVDGEFGVRTEYALKSFQKDHQLTANGVANQKTISTLVRIEREQYLRPLKSIEEDYYPGEQGDDIEKIQKALQYFGYYKGELDGIYGPLTDKALINFQQDQGLEVKQSINEKTVNQIYEAEPAETVAAPSPDTEQESEPKPVKKETASYSVSGLIATAKSFIGTPYVWGGESPGGFDCSGFIQYVYQAHGIKLGRTVSDIWNGTKPVSTLSVGDFVFYETYKAGPSHMGIYLGNNQFIHAGESNGVEVSDMGISYWQQRYIGAKRVAQ
ncbi:NlpC/P60 family protein [Radiobacillus kanasensis]|uniref:C40 family peptidase n=1 Tax=Radiobacillus kanasensis TaxID=2844358 RepID=UPI001E517EA9|nr:NlpC/P60 family protein [Radiobacillus kanasensis]UFU01254.1 NlpC/P60 family protein [Radiobacillus kanasensis]